MKIIFFSLLILFYSFYSYSQGENSLTKKEFKDGWVLLFNGKNTDGWTTPSGQPVTSGWVVKDGCISTNIAEKGSDVITKGQYTNFIFSVDFKIEPGCNSGIKYFYTKYPTGGNLGMEYQIIDDKLGEDNQKDNHLLGSLYDILAPTAKEKKVFPPGQWNNVRIVSKDGKVEHWLNGEKILEFGRNSKLFTDAVAKSKFSKTQPAFGSVKEGHLLLQYHGGEVSFRNIKIKQL